MKVDEMEFALIRSGTLHFRQKISKLKKARDWKAIHFLTRHRTAVAKLEASRAPSVFIAYRLQARKKAKHLLDIHF